VLVAAPDVIPGLTVPGSGAMEDMGSPGTMPMG
jgi:hypothetical protein